MRTGVKVLIIETATEEDNKNPNQSDLLRDFKVEFLQKQKPLAAPYDVATVMSNENLHHTIQAEL